MCSVCGKDHENEKVRKNLDITVDHEMVKSIKILTERINTANQGFRADAIPKDATEDQAKIFIKSVIEAITNYRQLQSDWWETVKTQYKLSDDLNIYVDFKTGELYTLV